MKLSTAVFSIAPVAAFVLAVGVAPARAQAPDDVEQGLTQPADQDATRSHQFTDVPTTSPFHPFVDWLVGRGFTGGCGPSLFCPNDAVTRGQLSVFLKVNSVTGSPLAFGFINSDGTKASGSANVTSSYDSVAGRYVITIANHSYFFSSYTTSVTLGGSTLCNGYTVSTSSVSGNLLVYMRTAAGATVQCNFQFSTDYNGI